jgi:hypothetical protein
MSKVEGDQRLWFIIDELDTLGEIDGLKDPSETTLGAYCARHSNLARHLAYWWRAVSDTRTFELGKTNEHLLNDLGTGFDLFIEDALRK